MPLPSWFGSPRAQCPTARPDSRASKQKGQTVNKCAPVRSLDRRTLNNTGAARAALLPSDCQSGKYPNPRVGKDNARMTLLSSGWLSSLTVRWSSPIGPLLALPPHYTHRMVSSIIVISTSSSCQRNWLNEQGSTALAIGSIGKRSHRILGEPSSGFLIWNLRIQLMQLRIPKCLQKANVITDC